MMYPIAILAGGLGARLGSLTEKTPKALITIAREPFIVHQLRLLKSKGFRQVILCVGHYGEMIQEVVGDGSSFDLEVNYSFDGNVLLGTAGCLKKALPLLGKKFFVIYGDSYLPCDCQILQHYFEESLEPALMTIHHNKNEWDSSNIEFEQGKIVLYDKQKKTSAMSYIDYGLAIFHADLFSNLPNHKPTDLAIFYQALIKKKQLAAYEIKEPFYEIGSKAGIARLEQQLFLMN